MTFLSDFGLSDEYVAVCKAVMRGIASQVEICDISHLIPPFSVRAGAMVLAESVEYFPLSVHLAVVDPGVGSSRRALIVQAEDGALLVGPDNGLLMPAAVRLGGPRMAWEIRNPALVQAQRSRTFHGRDIFSPAAAHLAVGIPPARFGPEIAVSSLIELGLDESHRDEGQLSGEVVHVDRYGNLQTSLGRSAIAEIKPGETVDVEVGERVVAVVVRESYSFGPPGELQLIEDSHECLAICVNRGSADDVLAGVGAGTKVTLLKGGGAVLSPRPTDAL